MEIKLYKTSLGIVIQFPNGILNFRSLWHHGQASIVSSPIAVHHQQCVVRDILSCPSPDITVHTDLGINPYIHFFSSSLFEWITLY